MKIHFATDTQKKIKIIANSSNYSKLAQATQFLVPSTLWLERVNVEIKCSFIHFWVKGKACLVFSYCHSGCSEAHNEGSREQKRALINPQQNTQEIAGDNVNTTT